MTHHPSRKQFFATLFGSAAALSVLPKLSAKPAETVTAKGNSNAGVLPVMVRPDARAVARRADTV